MSDNKNALITEIQAHVDDPDFDICDYPGIEQTKLTDEEERENQQAIAKLGKDFTILRKKVMPDCGKLSFPLTNAEANWVASNIRMNGWGIVYKCFELDEKICKVIDKYKTASRSKELYDAVKAINKESGHIEQEL